MKEFFRNVLIVIVFLLFIGLMCWRYASGFFLDLSIWKSIIGIFK